MTTLPRRRALGLAAILTTLLAVAVTVGGSARVALAHAELISASPGNQSVLDESPTEIVLGFSEAVDPIEPTIRLVDDQGAEVEIGGVSQPGGSDTMRADIPEELADGTYVVAWQALSADSHRVRGAFTFSVGEATSTAPGVIDGLFDTEASARSESLLLGIGRFLSYAGIAVLVGAFVMGAILLPGRPGDRRLGLILSVATGAGVVGTAWMIAAQAHLIAGSFLAWDDVADTKSGRWWLARLAAVAAYGAVLVARNVRSRATSAGGATGDGGEAGPVGPVGAIARWWQIVVLAVFGLGLLAVVSAGGHAAGGDDVALAVVATIIHLAAMAAWLGGLVVLAAAPAGTFWGTAQRLSPWALGAVVALALSGSFTAWRQLGSLADLTGSAYGRWLVVKLGLVLLVVAAAATSRWLLHTRRPDHVPAVRRTVGVELAGMALVLMATAGLVDTAPPSDAPGTASASAVVGDRIVQVELDPAVTGGTEMHVYLTSPGGGLDRADEITVSAELPAADLAPMEIATVPAGPNHVIGSDVDLPIAGLWTFEVTARYGEFDQVVFTMQIEVSD